MAEELAAETMIVRRHCEALSTASHHFVDRGVRPHFTLRSTNDERVMQMVAACLAITVMPVSYAWPGMARGALQGSWKGACWDCSMGRVRWNCVARRCWKLWRRR
jgi:LysR substrate binding domain.